MSDIIRLLPDSVANQIAAGEVIQRPASVVKELMENAIDAGADDIKVVIKDAGSALIQVIDNGSGMSELDARMAFERHATSKITDARDLFNLHTNGFRGEALASIAAVAQVELKTKRAEDELGTKIVISGSELEEQEEVVCAEGSNMMVKNLFFNVPARRRFLKKNEFTYIENEFKRIALTYPQVAMTLINGDTSAYQLPKSNIHQRIVNVFGRSINSKLVSIDSDTSLAKITGFVGTPESAKKNKAEQYFFVNGRFMKHAYFNRAVADAYGRLISADTYPSYFIFFDVEPGSIDVNVHPQKVEIKFENERAIYPVLMATVKEAIGKFSVAPMIDFDQEDAPEIPVFTDRTEVKIPKVNFNPNFNPFNTASQPRETHLSWESSFAMPQNDSFLDDIEPVVEQQSIEMDSFETDDVAIGEVTQFFNQYIAAQTENGLMLINQRYAHERIIFEETLEKMASRKMVSQQIMFPESMNFDASAAGHLMEINKQLSLAGFDITTENGEDFTINALPAEIASLDGISIVEEILEKAEIIGLEEDLNSIIAGALASQGAVKKHQELSADEMKNIVARLLKCKTPLYNPNGKKVMRILSEKDVENLL